MKPSKGISYSEFMKLPVQQRKIQAEYFLKNNPDYIPTLITSTSPEIPQLKNCKYLIPANQQIYVQMTRLRNFISKSSKISKEEQLFFYVKSKILNQNQKGIDLYQKVKHTLPDGWLVITYNKEATF